MNSDDELLASAFRKILTAERYHYVNIGQNTDYVTLDSRWTADDGLTADEFAAIRRTIEGESDSLSLWEEEQN